MTALSFQMVDARAAAHAAVPTILFRLRVAEHSGALIHAMVLRAQIRIEPQRRRYSPEEEDRLYELFGETPQWGDSLRPFLWTHAACTTSGFGGAIEVDLPVECTYDFEVTAAKYLHSVSDGEIPLLFLFSGTVFTRGQSGFSAEPVGWEQEAQFRLPARVWRELMDQYFPHSGWIRLDRDVFDALQLYKAQRALPTWDQAVGQLLKAAETLDGG
jgi:hypothetical protein